MMLPDPLLDELPPELDLLVQLAIDDDRPTVILDSSESHPICLYKNPAFQSTLAHVAAHALEDWLFTELNARCTTEATPTAGFANREWVKKKLGTRYAIIYCKESVSTPPGTGEDGSLDSLIHDWIRFPLQVPTTPWIRYLLDYDWSKTAIGTACGPDMRHWPAQLREVLLAYMHCPRPRIIYWGPDLIQFYNESAVKLWRAKHPAALGNKQVDIWGQEVKDLTVDLIRNSWEEGQSVHNKEVKLPLDRDGFLEESYFDWFLVPFTGSDGRWICSVNCFNEVTSDVVRRNRDDVSSKLLEKTTRAADLHGLWLEFSRILDEEADDVAYSLLYAVHEEAGTSDVEKRYEFHGSPGLSSHMNLENPSNKLIKVFEQAEGGENVILLNGNNFLPELGITVPEAGTVTSAFVFTIFDVKGLTQGSVVIGVNPQRRADDSMGRFIYSLSEMLLKAVIILQSPSDQRKLLQADDSLGYRIQLEKLTRQLSVATLKNEKNQETFSRMAEDAPIGMFLYQGDGTPIYLNDCFLELLGETREDFHEKAKTGLAWRDCIHPDDEEFSKNAWKEVAESHQVMVFDFRVKAGTDHSPNRARWLEVVCFPQRDENNVLVTFQGYLTDITSKKLTEALTTERMNAAIETKRKAQNFIDMISVSHPRLVTMNLSTDKINSMKCVIR
jgi:PAS domain S-box-containing protein